MASIFKVELSVLLVVAVICCIGCGVPAASAADLYRYWGQIDTAVAIYEMPLATLEERVLARVEKLPDLQVRASPVAFATEPPFDGSDSVLRAPKGMTLKSVILHWTPDPQKLSADVKKQWRADISRGSSVHLTIGFAHANPSRSFLIVSRDWRLKGGAHIPRTNVPLPFSLSYVWGQLLASDEAFLRDAGTEEAGVLIPGAHLYDPRLLHALICAEDDYRQMKKEPNQHLRATERAPK